jgi:phosphoribosylformimino-5-aminoimidazole carboxamide ribotide isomerase
MAFDIFPAIDLRHGRVVRLQLGDPRRQSVYSDDPVEVARRWQDAGATWLHVVNLDGAFDESGSSNWEVLPAIANVGMKVQFGGGLRSTTDIDRAFSAGVSRLVLGTAAFESPALVSEVIALFGSETIAVGIDAQDGRVKTRGWQIGTEVSPLELGKAMHNRGVEIVIYTDISRDGILAGVNVASTVALADATGLTVIASGGVRALSDVEALLATAHTGIAGVIIGRALYEGQVDLAQAVALTREE